MGQVVCQIGACLSVIDSTQGACGEYDGCHPCKAQPLGFVVTLTARPDLPASFCGNIEGWWQKQCCESVVHPTRSAQVQQNWKCEVFDQGVTVYYWPEK